MVIKISFFLKIIEVKFFMIKKETKIFLLKTRKTNFFVMKNIQVNLVIKVFIPIT
jgi:hypothetical protein